MGIDLILKKNDHEIYFGRSHNYETEETFDSIKTRILTMLLEVLVNSTSAYDIVNDIESIIEDAITIGKKSVIDELIEDGYESSFN